MLSDRDVARVAAEAALDVRTVRRALIEGEPPRSKATAAAIRAALFTLKIKTEKTKEKKR